MQEVPITLNNGEENNETLKTEITNKNGINSESLTKENNGDNKRKKSKENAKIKTKNKIKMIDDITDDADFSDISVSASKKRFRMQNSIEDFSCVEQFIPFSIPIVETVKSRKSSLARNNAFLTALIEEKQKKKLKNDEENKGSETVSEKQKSKDTKIVKNKRADSIFKNENDQISGTQRRSIGSGRKSLNFINDITKLEIEKISLKREDSVKSDLGKGEGKIKMKEIEMKKLFEGGGGNMDDLAERLKPLW